MDGGVVVRQGQGEELNVIGCTVRFLCGAKQTGDKWSLMETVLAKDMGPPPHRHDWDEAYYVIEGRVQFDVDGRKVTIGPGEFLYAPANTPHGFTSQIDDTRMLIIDCPAHTENFFREVDREIREMPRDLAKMPAIGARNGITFL
ncbi:MAG: cupin domain-containing protein [Bacillota bacterium]